MGGTRAPSLLTSLTLCLAAQSGAYIGSDYEQLHEAELGGPVDTVVLPDLQGQDEDIGQNVILCPMYGCEQ
jgi:hypothetical protein